MQRSPLRFAPISRACLLMLVATLLLLPFSTARAAPPPTGTVTLEGEIPAPVISGGAHLLGPRDATSSMTINLGLPLRNQAQLQGFINDEATKRVSLTQAQFDAQYAPSSDQVQAVKDWAQSHNLQIAYASPDGLSIVARGATSAVAAALGVQINTYQDMKGRTFYSADRDPTLPASLGLQSITGLDSYEQFRSFVTPYDAPMSGYTPANFRNAYDESGHGYDGTGQTIGLTLWGAAVSDSDLSTFAANSGDTPMSAGTGPDQIEWIPVNGNAGATDDGVQGEIAMDVEYAHAMATHSHLKYFLGDCTLNNGSCSASDVGLEVAIAQATNDPTIHIVSNSWGGPEASLTSSVVQQTTNNFMHAVAVGTTFYFSTGDSAKNSGGTNLPSYPADSPYVVAVGGTHLDTTVSSTYNNYLDESAWSLKQDGSGGGGGCSVVFARPSWQVGVESAATCTGRAEPDIAADADSASGAYVYYNGSDHVIGGTSLAAPLTAGMAAVTNRYLTQNGKPLMGWAAPTIYQLATSANYRSYFHDVQCGNNGYPAQGGWDQATGWGSQDWYQYTLGWAGQAPGPALLPDWGCQDSGGQAWYKRVACATTAMCVAVGESGAISTTSNGGGTWTTQNSGVTSTLFGVACPSVTTCYAVGSTTQILKTTDGGTTWISQSTPLTGGYMESITCTSTTTCYATGTSSSDGGGGGFVLKMTDGTTWTESVIGITSSNIQVDMYGISCPTSTVCYAVGDFGMVAATADGGTTWGTFTNLPANLPSNIFLGITCPNIANCYIVGESGMIVHTSDAGNTWDLQSNGDTSSSVIDVACVSVSTCYTVGKNGDIFSTSDSGAHWNWEVDPSPYMLGADLDGIACPDNSTCYAVGFFGTILSKNAIAPINVPISPGWNLISLSRQLTGISSMSTLTASLDASLGNGAVKALATYSNGRFQLYAPGYSADANLSATQGIFLLSAAPATRAWTLTGSDYPSGVPMILNKGWNLVAAPYPASGLLTTSIQAEAGACGVQQIVSYSGGAYHPWSPGQPALTVPATGGVWIQCASSGVWMPA